jgi:hypothetical protein
MRSHCVLKPARMNPLIAQFISGTDALEIDARREALRQAMGDLLAALDQASAAAAKYTAAALTLVRGDAELKALVEAEVSK